MEQLEPTGQNKGILNSDSYPILFISIIVLFVWFVFPLVLIFLVPIIAIIFIKKLNTKVTVVPGSKPVKKRDPRRFWVTLLVLVLGLTYLYINPVSLSGSPDISFSSLLGSIMLIGICTGGFVWAPLISILIAQISLAIYDRYLGKSPLPEVVQGTTTVTQVSATVAPKPITTQAPTITPNFYSLSPTDQSLVFYIATASTRGISAVEININLKKNGWLDADISHGFDLVRTYYPGVLK